MYGLPTFLEMESRRYSFGSFSVGGACGASQFWIPANSPESKVVSYQQVYNGPLLNHVYGALPFDAYQSTSTSLSRCQT